DDGAGALLLHLDELVLHEAHEAEDVDVEETLPGLALLFGERLCRCAEAGVVVSEVEAAPAADDLVDDGGGIVFRRCVDDPAFGGAALGADGLTGLFDSLGDDIGDQDLRPGTRECDRAGPSDAASGG